MPGTTKLSNGQKKRFDHPKIEKRNSGNAVLTDRAPRLSDNKSREVPYAQEFKQQKIVKYENGSTIVKQSKRTRPKILKVKLSKTLK